MDRFSNNWSLVPARFYPFSRKESFVDNRPKSFKPFNVSYTQKKLFVAFQLIYSSQEFEEHSKVNFQKEFDDCVSRYMNAKKPSIEQLNLELSKMGVSNEIDPNDDLEVDVEVGLCNGCVVVSVCDKYYFINSYKRHVKYLLSRKIKYRDICEIVLTHFNMRSGSGTNWSPIESHYGVAKHSKTHTVIECFASPFNNTITFHKLNRRKGKCPVRYVLTKQKCDNKIPEIVGSWPMGVYNLIPKIEGPVMLLVNVPFTEDMTISALHEIEKILNTFPERTIRVRTCLPAWDDLYERDDIKELFEKWNYSQKLYTSSKSVRNFYFDEPIKFKFYVGDMVREKSVSNED